MTFLLGRQATLGQAPPMRLSSMLMTCCPSEPRCQAMYLPASPLPMMMASYRSAWFGVDMGISVGWIVGTGRPCYRMRKLMGRVHRRGWQIESHGGDEDASQVALAAEHRLSDV